MNSWRNLCGKFFGLAVLCAALIACNLARNIKDGIDKAGQPTVLTSKDGRFQLTIPGGWRADSSLNAQATIGGSNALSEMYVAVITESKGDYAKDFGLREYTRLIRDQMMKVVKESTATEPSATTINGHPAMQYELRGTVERVSIAYLMTIVETPKDFHQVVTWTLPSRFDKNKETLQQVTASFKEKEGAVNATIPPMPSSANSNSPTPTGRRR